MFPDDFLALILVVDTHAGDNRGIVACEQRVVDVFGSVLDQAYQQGFFLEQFYSLSQYFQELRVGVLVCRLFTCAADGALTLAPAPLIQRLPIPDKSNTLYTYFGLHTAP